MFSVSYDKTAALVVSSFSGPTNTDADYAAYCANIEELKAEALDLLRIAILTISSDNPMPNASWRKRIADASADVAPNSLFILVSDRPAVRGILTAINWVRPPTYQWAIKKSFGAAIDLAATYRPDAVARLLELHDECRAQATTA